MFYALQKDKVPKGNNAGCSRKSLSSVQLKNAADNIGGGGVGSVKDALSKKVLLGEKCRSISESSLSSSSSNEKSGEGSKFKGRVNRSKSSTIAVGDDNTLDVIEEKKSQENMAFSHLG